MTRPLALIEGDLTIPLPRPFDGLPPPFGSRHRVLREAVQHAVNEIAKPAQATPFPAGVKHILFYKAPPQRVDTSRRRRVGGSEALSANGHDPSAFLPFRLPAGWGNLRGLHHRTDVAARDLLDEGSGKAENGVDHARGRGLAGRDRIREGQTCDGRGGCGTGER